ncbi:hypothetical protein XF_b0002 (plasmid) [Xylella fastidiosa 9a5c]|uniref:Uncharacterized protein n=1 Tax=Xylella fastidiosa (strain 9a5c) TaxID=160492 RepID=Q9PHK5_XYLFA|nr:hypothetical protein XF_b0002 [Xylella fastidiosa 9a5c]
MSPGWKSRFPVVSNWMTFSSTPLDLTSSDCLTNCHWGIEISPAFERAKRVRNGGDFHPPLISGYISVRFVKVGGFSSFLHAAKK